MDINKENQEFDLEDILNEFHDLSEEMAAEVEPDEELEQLLHMPQLTITPVVVRTSDETPVELPSEQPLSGDTIRFDSVKAQLSEAAEAQPEAAVAEDVTSARVRSAPRRLSLSISSSPSSSVRASDSSTPALCISSSLRVSSSSWA